MTGGNAVCVFAVDVVLLAFRNFHIYISYYFLSLSIREHCLSAYAHFHEIHTVPQVYMTSYIKITGNLNGFAWQ